MATGEDWYKIMFDTTRSREYGCSDDFRSCGNGNIYNWIDFGKAFFIFYTIIVQYIMLNLFILVLM